MFYLPRRHAAMPRALMQGAVHLEGQVPFLHEQEKPVNQAGSPGLLSTHWGHLFLNGTKLENRLDKAPILLAFSSELGGRGVEEGPSWKFILCLLKGSRE